MSDSSSSSSTTTTPTPTDLAGVWTIDTAHSSVGFSVRHMMVSKVRGRFTEYEGTITIAEDPLQSTAVVTVQTASITTNDDKRDEHLRSGDFFDVETYPTMTFQSTALSGADSEYQLGGDLTIRGVTRPVVFDVEFNGAGHNPWGAMVAGFSATAGISREDFGLTWNQPLESGGILVGDKVTIELDIEATKSD